MLIFHSLILLISSGTYAATIEKRYALAPQISPSFPSSMPTPTNVVTSYNSGPYDTSTTLSTKPLTGFPTTWVPADTTSQEVKDMYNKIDWTKVPNAPVRKQNADGSWVSTSDGASDPYCWWSSTNCVTPKASYLPKDIYTCPNKGDWGLNYDDGPFNRYTDSNAAEQNPYAEPALYNYLASNNLHSTLFVSSIYIYIYSRNSSICLLCSSILQIYIYIYISILAPMLLIIPLLLKGHSITVINCVFILGHILLSQLRPTFRLSPSYTGL